MITLNLTEAEHKMLVSLLASAVDMADGCGGDCLVAHDEDVANGKAEAELRKAFLLLNKVEGASK